MGTKTWPEAAWWHPLSDGRVACDLCPIGCRLREGQDGPCGTRGVRDGRMVALQYGRVVAAGIDPIEKKPLYHFHPGRPILSLAAPGCNLHCAFCQNWTISQQHDGLPTEDLPPAAAVSQADRDGSIGVAYTYTEPLVWYEYVRDTARLVRERGLVNVLVTNGYLEPGPLAELLPLIDAANVDLKSMDDDFYRRVCKARLDPVLAAIRRIRAAGVHLEITNLVIPGHNDSDEQLAALVDFVADELGREVPLHFSAYHPAWQFDAPATPPRTLLRAAEIARRRLDFVYLGNVNLAGESDTRCPGCGTVVVRRGGFSARVALGPGATCPGCGRRLPIVV